MLFDLQSRNRRTAVKIIYLGLAILMGGGLVLFGIGTGTGGGGLLDVFTGGGSSTSAQISSAEKRANHEVRLHPQDPRAWADLARARLQTAGLGDNYDQTANQGTGAFTAKGRAKLRTAGSAWQRYLTLEPNPDPKLAQVMTRVYDENGLNDPAQTANAWEIVTGKQPTAAYFGFLAQYAYMAGQERKGDLAAARAVQLAVPAQRRLLRTQLAAIKSQAQLQAGRGSTASGRAAPQTKRTGDTSGVG